MKQAMVLTAVAASLFALNSTAYSLHNEPVTPYGGVCTKCGQYGTCKSTLTSFEGMKALEDYYSKKGLKVELDGAHGRFIKAKVIDSGRLVDIIIFDRATGRVRSIF